MQQHLTERDQFGSLRPPIIRPYLPEKNGQSLNEGLIPSPSCPSVPPRVASVTCPYMLFVGTILPGRHMFYTENWCQLKLGLPNAWMDRGVENERPGFIWKHFQKFKLAEMLLKFGIQSRGSMQSGAITQPSNKPGKRPFLANCVEKSLLTAC